MAKRPEEIITLDELKALCKEAIKDLKSIGIPVDDEHIKTIRWRRGTLLGCTSYMPSDKIRKWEIGFNYKFKYSLKSPNSNITLKDVIYHELIHTAPNCFESHNGQWMVYARKAEKEFGLNLAGESHILRD